jgi:DNA end-binding protein Ku
MARRKTKRKPRDRRRASWQGQLTFGLVSFGVEAFNAINRQGSDIHFHQLHEPCHSRIHYQKVCPVHGEVSNDEIVSGYEHRKGKYVEVDPDELDELRSEREKALTIDAFIPPESVDPLYFDGRMYYLLPDGAGSKDPYNVLVAAMEREDRYAVGRIVFSGKDQVVLLRPLERLLHMAMLNYDAEIRRPEQVASSLKRPSGLTRQVRLAQTLIRESSDDRFDFAQYEDPYRERVEELIDAKVKGREIVTPEEEEPPQVVNLMDALKKSVGAVGKTRSRSRSRSRSRRSA